MANLISILAAISEPTGLWYTILKWVDSWVFSLGWTIVLFTIFIKVILSPMDFYNKYLTRKNTLIQKRLAPQVEKLNKTYASRKDLANQQVSALYKKEGYNMIGSCFFILINLILTLVVFFTFFSSLRSMSEFKMLKQYETLQETYFTTLSQTDSEAMANDAVILKYDEVKDDFLWIKNIWRSDTSASIIPNYDDLQKAIKNTKSEEYKNYLNSVSEEDYNRVTQPLKDKYTGWNGYYILAILAAVTAFLSQWVAERSNKSKKEIEVKQEVTIQGETQKTTMGIMKVLLPLIMVVFVLTNTASFGVYIVVSSLISILISFVINIFVFKLTKNEEEKYNLALEKMQKNIIKSKNKTVVKRPNITPGAKL